MNTQNRYVVLVIVSFLLSQIVGAQQLQSYIEEAEMNNPQIQAFEIRYKISEEKINEANWLPNTEISAGYFVSEPETRTGPQRARLSLRQMLPWFGTITARENYASSMADSDFVEVIIAKRKLALSVTQNYYNLYETRAKQIVLDENIKLLETYERLALTSIEVGKASVVDVLRLQIRQNELQQQKEVLKQEASTYIVALNNLLNRDTNTPIETITILEVPVEESNVNVDGLQLNPELLKYDKLLASVSQSELLNQREGLPMIGFGLDYIAVSNRTDMNPVDNGKDILMPMVSISIPIFNNRFKSISKQNALQELEINTQKAQQLNMLETALAKAVAERNNARIIYNSQNENLKQAKDAENILIKNYETGTIDFNDVLDIQELQLKIQLNQINAITTYYLQSAVVNYLTM